MSNAEIKSGAEALVETFANCGVTYCFANPGTSEMHLVQALDKEPRIKSVLCLFEGVATGAADGFARMTGLPAMTLLHLGPGYGNGLANVHNAMRAYSPMINVIGDHATYHRDLDAPLTSDIETLIKPHNSYIGVVENAGIAGEVGANAFVKSITAPASPVAVVLPADSAWGKDGKPQVNPLLNPIPLVDNSVVKQVYDAVKTAKSPAILVGGDALYDELSLKLLGQMSESGIRILIDTFPARQRRGKDLFHPDKMLYFAEMAIEDLQNHDLLVIAGSQSPVAFFAYPNTPSMLVPETTKVVELSARHHNTKQAIADLANLLELSETQTQNTWSEIPIPEGKINAYKIGKILARHLPENSIISDDAVTCGLPIYTETRIANNHDWLFLTGGAIGQGLSLAVGAQLAFPERRTFALLGDGASMYNIQALWTMVREKLPIITFIFANRSYKILNIEMERTGAGAVGDKAREMLSLDTPALDFVKIAEGMGMRAQSVSSCEELDSVLEHTLTLNEPVLIEICL
jgi:acetolactate synthase-1/2/3 large subunit